MKLLTYLKSCLPSFPKSDLLLRSEKNCTFIQINQKDARLFLFLTGRPDGITPFGFESYWEYFKKNPAKRNVRYAEKVLLYRELVLYGMRSLALFHLEMYDLCQRDCYRNLSAIEDILSWLNDDPMVDLFRALMNPNMCLLFTSRAYQNVDRKGSYLCPDSMETVGTSVSMFN